MAPLRALACSIAFIAGTAAAQVPLPFWDDFEIGTLDDDDVPPGRWVFPYEWPGSSVVASDAGARDRTYGLRATDNASNDNDTSSVVMYQLFVRAAGDRYFRGWVRITPSTAAGNIMVGQLYDGQATDEVCGLRLRYPSGEVSVEGISGAAWFAQDAGVYLANGTWHLMECGLQDGGTAATELVVWVDGVEHIRRSVDHTSVWTSSVAVGQVYSPGPGTFQGTVDVDDVAVTTTPPPSRIRIDAGTGALTADACAPIELGLLSSAGGPAAAYRPQTLTVSVSGPSADVYSDGACSSLASPSVQVGQTATVVWVRSSVGALTLTAQAGDLFADSAVFSVLAGGGPQPLDLVTSCDCGEAPGHAPVALLLVLALWRSRPNRRPSARG